MGFLKVVRSLGLSKIYGKNSYELFVDRFNHTFSFYMLIIFTLVITFVEFTPNSIGCFVTDNSTFESDTSQICWQSGLNIPLNEDLTVNENERTKRLLYWFKWTPVILLFQAFFFYLPLYICPIGEISDLE